MSDFNWIENGSVTSVPGFRASGVTAGLKKSGKADAGQDAGQRGGAEAAAGAGF
jgi:N-acetylglutamate synthase/N-acetylornithine aminotransferase